MLSLKNLKFDVATDTIFDFYYALFCRCFYSLMIGDVCLLGPKIIGLGELLLQRMTTCNQHSASPLSIAIFNKKYFHVTLDSRSPHSGPMSFHLFLSTDYVNFKHLSKRAKKAEEAEPNCIL